MNEIIFLIGITAVVAFNAAAAYVLAWIFTERLILPLRFKPFNCRPCLSLWLTVLLNAGFALFAAHRFDVFSPLVTIYGISAVGGLLGIINYLYINSKFKIYD